MLGSTTRSGFRSSRNASMMSKTLNNFHKNTKAFDSLLGDSKRGNSVFAAVSFIRSLILFRPCRVSLTKLMRNISQEQLRNLEKEETAKKQTL